jgi:predicted dehydrogenase
MGNRMVGVVVEGATGRLGTTQHLRSLMAIRSEGGLPLANGDRLVPEPVLLGRNPARLSALAAANGGLRWSIDGDTCLADPDIAIYFDASATGGRPARVGTALDAGKHVYVEKPLAETLADAMDLARRAERAGLKNGVVQDKLFLPGLTKLRKLYEADFFGRVLSVRLDFGWWVFDGTPYPAQRPSWNYRKATGAGLILDMFAHWRYIFDRCSARSKPCHVATSRRCPNAATRPAILTGSMSRIRPSRYSSWLAACRRKSARLGRAGLSATISCRYRSTGPVGRR